MPGLGAFGCRGAAGRSPGAHGPVPALLLAVLVTGPHHQAVHRHWHIPNTLAATGQGSRITAHANIVTLASTVGRAAAGCRRHTNANGPACKSRGGWSSTFRPASWDPRGGQRPGGPVVVPFPAACSSGVWRAPGGGWAGQRAHAHLPAAARVRARLLTLR